eukprot:NODE_18_length_47517_cov_0.674814.p5 type:complete len:593 gc:universal NODE_18_length_47517_cov_0.674814:41510-43288(+)
MFYFLINALLTQMHHNLKEDTLSVKLNAYGVTHDMQLVKNSFLSEKFTALKISNETITEEIPNDCYYINENAAFRYCDGIHGIFYSEKLNQTIQVDEHPNGFIISNTSLPSHNWCATDGDYIFNSTEGFKLHKREVVDATIELLVIGDHFLVEKYGNKTIQHILDVVNVASSIYNANTFVAPLNVTLNAIMTFDEPSVSSYVEGDILNALTGFIEDLLDNTYFNGTKFDFIRNVDHVNFLTTNKMPGDPASSDLTVGIAKLAGMCYQNSVSAVSEYFISSASSVVGFAVAHEIGHSLGAVHDSGVPSQCPVTGYVMAPYLVNPPPFSFSPCSIQSINSMLFEQAIGLISPCLFDTSKPVNISKLCGNGIVDYGSGEECDATEESKCCTSDCKLKKNAICEDTNGQCCHDCQLASSSSVCRRPTQNVFSAACDASPITYCDGKSVYCPFNDFLSDKAYCKYKMNTILNEGLCYSGQCYNRENICLFSGFRYGNCDAENNCKVTCDAAGSCTQTGDVIPDGARCGYYLDGFCKSGNCFNNTKYTQKEIASSSTTLRNVKNITYLSNTQTVVSSYLNTETHSSDANVPRYILVRF